MRTHFIRARILNAVTLTILLTIPFLPSTPFTRPAESHAAGTAGGAKGGKAINTLRGFVAPPREAPGEPHVLAASYYSVVGNTSATLTLNNKGPEPKEVRLSLFSLGGERFDPHPLTVGANSHRVVDLGEYATAGTPFEEGSLQVTYHGKKLEMGVQVKLADTARSLIFDEQLVEPAYKFASSRLDFGEVSSSLGRGSMSIKLVRLRPTKPNKHVDFTITGKNPSGTVGSFGGQGKVILNCP